MKPKTMARAIAVSSGQAMATIQDDRERAANHQHLQERLSQSWVMMTILCADARCA